MTVDQAAWLKLNNDESEPLRNRAVRDSAPLGDAFHLVVAAAALEKGLYSSVDEATHSPPPAFRRAAARG
ncbi:penicillin-binding protein [Streptomyces sp. NBRC 110611]|uniref:hypothetical protein n=1 Tax=Streptomyces sp. NBRC 110611 TaxID=1621259 RepID=UPI0008582FFE|nr:hypothetical protein [Streptomyces sp. NBRC 110611]GAU64967.1 penicillin-binding protein [Streptomyces sp. NBRC 110611]